MSTYASPLSSGKTSPQGALRILGKLFTSSGVIGDSLTVSAQDTPDMSVKVSGSATDDIAVFINTDGHFIQGWNDADANVAIDPNNTGSTQADSIIAYVDVNDGQGDAADPANNPGALNFIAVRSSQPTLAATVEDIEAVIGESVPYVVLAKVVISNGASSINSGNITDERVTAQVDGEHIELADESVTPAKRSGGFKVGTFTTNSSTGDQSVTGIGFRPKMVRFYWISPSSATYRDWDKGMEGVMDKDGNQWAKGWHQHTNGQTKLQRASNGCMFMISHSGGALTTTLAAGFVSMNADGFTINLTVATAELVGYEAYG